MRQGAHQMRDLEPLFPLAFCFGILVWPVASFKTSMRKLPIFGQWSAWRFWEELGYPWLVCEPSSQTKQSICSAIHQTIICICEICWADAKEKNFLKIWVQTSSVWRSCDFTKNLFHGVQDGPGTRAWYLIVGESMREHHVHSFDAFSDSCSC